MIKIKSPTRVDLAGGTLDCWPLHLFVGDCKTVNLAIDICTGCELEINDNSKIELNVKDLNWSKTYNNLSDLLSATDSQIKLVQMVIDYFRPKFGFKLNTFSQSPVGAGLGGSSSLCISLIKAFSQALDIDMNPMGAVELAHNIEAKVLMTPTGTQDYFPALLGGLNTIHYTAAGIKIDTNSDSLDDMWKNIMLVYTGKSDRKSVV